MSGTEPLLWQSFALQPFRPHGQPSSLGDPAHSLTLCGRIRRRASRLEIRFLLQGDLSLVSLASPAAQPRRLDDLWRTTCFEFFLGAAADPGYWEVNLSPAGHWNVYRFTDTRQGMEPERSVQALPFRLSRMPLESGPGSGGGEITEDGPAGGAHRPGEQLELVLEWELPLPLRAEPVPLGPSPADGPPLDVGVCAVIDHPHHPLSYWALTHPGPEADFHRRDGFVLRL
jgi:hypothetical protein